ncbi:hypothetical protein BS329_20805 [Amycolatopsis coloradensis]|uniref:FAD-binding PCMH-type domain-containing protein n=1 Tax=Amycolatopsis coloradensis TaxID=76021 RepID=A0A1R0KR04_9PSEU|nr:FAD-binding protein [Amycolatopsis coloradensis]OLZ50066.1 hypothetical protein BS329_20805 [Amycolatopsis coloradensis]
MVLNELARWRETVQGAVIEPGDQRFASATRPWSLTVEQRPVAVVVAADVEDVAATVGFAARQGRQVAVQATGHGAIDSLDGAILLRTGALRGVTVDPSRRRARLGPGVSWRDVQRACAPHGLSGLTGTAPGVGATGYTLTGGLGLLARRHGLAAHRLMAAELVTGDGRRLSVDRDRYPDLWCALRGGGTPPGVVTEIEIELVPAPVLCAGQLIWSAESAPELFGAFRSWTSTLPDEMTTTLGVQQVPSLPSVPEPLRGRRVVTLTVAHLGEEEETRRLLRPLLDLAQPLSDTLVPRKPDDLDVAGVPTDPAPTRARTELLTDLPDAALDVLTDLGPDAGPLMLTEIRHLGGALTRSAATSTPMNRVEGEFLLETVGLLFREEDFGALAIEQARIHDAVRQVATGRTLRSFANAGDRDAERFFSTEALALLNDVARRYDPGAVIHNPTAG